MKIHYEVDIQKDFMNETGALYVPGAEAIKGNIEKLVELAVKNKTRRICSEDYHFVDDDELKVFPPHCMCGTVGQARISEVNIRAAPRLHHKMASVACNHIIKNYTKMIQWWATSDCDVIIEKQAVDVSSNPHAELLIKEMDVTDALVYGVATEYCVLAAVKALSAWGVRCTVVSDAIAGIDPAACVAAINEMKSLDAVFMTTEEAHGW